MVFYSVHCSHLSGFNLYHTDHLINGLDRDCLYYHVTNDGIVYQVLEYCIRFQLNETILYNNNHHSSFTFEDLSKLNITSHQLYTWSASIDLIENYQNYLEKKNLSLGTFPFYNCTYPWFGSHCEYSFDQAESTFAQQIKANLVTKGKISRSEISQKLPCYTHLECDRVGDYGKTSNVCLDWREICDGKIDCINSGHDEEECWQLEINECDNKTEFRCHIGLCIPSIFINDDEHSPECLDESDERYVMKADMFFHIRGRDLPCRYDLSFRCEEYMCRPMSNNVYQIQCGDGTCAPLYGGSCGTERNQILVNSSITGINLSEKCYLPVGYLSGLIPIINHSNGNWTSNLLLYANDVKQYCEVFIKHLPIMFGHVQFVYINNRSWVSQ